MTRQEFNRLAKASEQAIRDAFLGDFRGIVSAVVLEELVEAVRAGDIDRAWGALGVTPGAFRQMTEAERAAFLAGGVATARTLDRGLPRPEGASAFRFTMDDAAEASARTITGSLIREITEDTRTLVRERIERGLAATEHPRHVALDIVGRRRPGTHTRAGGMLGLTRAQDSWAQNVEAELSGDRPMRNYFNREARDRRFDATVRRAIREGRPVPADQRRKIVAAYRSRLLRMRGETIARTEAIRSINAGSHASIDQAVQGGRIPAEDVIRTWLSTPDTRTRDAHRAMNGQQRPFGQPFESPTGAHLMYPGDTSLGAGSEDVVSCRCTFATTLRRAA